MGRTPQGLESRLAGPHLPVVGSWRCHAWDPSKFVGVVLALAGPVSACSQGGPVPPRVSLQTSLGDRRRGLPDQAPVTAANFLRYVDEARLDSAVFYRVVNLENSPTTTCVSKLSRAVSSRTPRVPVWRPYLMKRRPRRASCIWTAPSPWLAGPRYRLFGDLHHHRGSTFLDFGGARNSDGQGSPPSPGGCRHGCCPRDPGPTGRGTDADQTGADPRRQAIALAVVPGDGQRSSVRN